ncbi:Phage protein [uncultured Candidatus Thioglobus sp.]|nr:Phage protein [uncultured Candidatus Thioglobus sp.]
MSSPAIQFDTHKFIKRLTAHGFSEEQAEALAEEQVNLLNDNLATKEDIAKIESNLKLEMSKIESNLKLEMSNIESNLKLDIAKTDTKIEATRAELLKWIIGLSIAQATIIVSIVGWMINP